MTVTHLPADTTVTAATDVAVTDHTVTVINADDVHRDWRPLAFNIARAGGVITGIPGVGLVAAEQDLASYPFVVAAAVCIVAAIGLHVQITRDNRRWVLTTDVDPQ